MKCFLLSLVTLLGVTTLYSQEPDKDVKTIDVQGYSKLLANPGNYSAIILIQEEEQKVGYTTVGKLSIDSIKANLFLNLKKFGVDEKELKIITVSSKEISQFPIYLANISYEVKLKSKDIASKLVNEMRFVGLKGLVIKRVYSQAQKDALADSLYNDALADARRIATALAGKSNRTIDQVRSVELRSNAITMFGADQEANTDFYNTYGYSKFEMDCRDKYATCYIRVIFDVK